MNLSSLMNEFRVWPRAQLVFWGAMVYKITEWATALPDISNGQAAIVSTVYVSAAAYGKFYGETDIKKPIYD